MKNYLKNSNNMTLLSTIGIVLVVMAGVGLYYLQASRADTYYIYSFGYGVLFLCSLFMFLHNILCKEKENTALSLGILLFSTASLISSIIANIDALNIYSTIATDIGMALFIPALLTIGEKSFNVCSFLKNRFFKLVLAVVMIALLIVQKWFYYYNSTIVLLYIFYGLCIATLIYGIIASVIAVSKNKETTLNYSNIIVALSLLCVYVQKITNSYILVRTSKAVALIALSVMLIGLVKKEISDTKK